MNVRAASFCSQGKLYCLPYPAQSCSSILQFHVGQVYEVGVHLLGSEMLKDQSHHMILLMHQSK